MSCALERMKTSDPAMSDLLRLNPTPHAVVYVRFAATVASATLATKRTLLLTWTGLTPAGSHQRAACALIRSPYRR